MSIAYTMIIITLLITGLVAALTLWIRYKKMSKLAKIITIFLVGIGVIGLLIDIVVRIFISRFITDSSTFTIERRTIYELSIVRGCRTANTFGWK